MKRTIQIKASSLDDAYKESQNIFFVPSDKIYVEKINDDTYDAILDLNIALEARKYLMNFFKSISVDAQIRTEVIEKDKNIRFYINTSNNRLFTNQNGRLIELLESLVKKICEQYVKHNLEIFIDIGNYRKEKFKNLEKLALEFAKEVALTKVSIHLDPMSNYERKIIHERLKSIHTVTTKSEGKDKNRHIVIKPR